jgi:hypothetical protein
MNTYVFCITTKGDTNNSKQKNLVASELTTKTVREASEFLSKDSLFSFCFVFHKSSFFFFLFFFFLFFFPSFGYKERE